MVRERGATSVAHKLATAINLASAAVLLLGMFLFAGPAFAREPDRCADEKLGPGDQANPPDLVINHDCHVGAGAHYFNNVNILSGGPPGATPTPGTLIFEESPRRDILFCAVHLGGEWGQSRGGFYRYDALPFDNGKVGDKTGYFGYKVLAVSYGGTLRLFGKLGATAATLQPKETGTSWVRLASYRLSLLLQQPPT